MEFIWNDGGRAASGYVGLAGDCVTRAIAIATGALYRDVYQELGEACQKSPRNGVRAETAAQYLAERGWQRWEGFDRPFFLPGLPQGLVIVHLARHERAQHFCTLIDQVVHDTWNAYEDDDYLVRCYWTSPMVRQDTTLPVAGPKRRISQEQELTQSEFDRILKRLRALDATACNRASTEGEKRNALRMMQCLMLSHNLTRDDIVDEDNVDSIQFTRVACPVNGRRACNWEGMLATYVTCYIFPMVQYYRSTKGHRTLFWFYGPRDDVQNAITIFRELLLGIATAAQLQYGGHFSGSGASYAEGYVRGLPRGPGGLDDKDQQTVNEGTLIHVRTLALQNAASRWLELECNIQLTTRSLGGRYAHDDAAASRGKLHGSKHQVQVPGTPPRIAHL